MPSPHNVNPRFEKASGLGMLDWLVTELCSEQAVFLRISSLMSLAPLSRLFATALERPGLHFRSAEQGRKSQRPRSLVAFAQRSGFVSEADSGEQPRFLELMTRLSRINPAGRPAQSSRRGLTLTYAKLGMNGRSFVATRPF